MSEEASARRFSPLLLVALALLVALGGWHYFCHLMLEAGLEEHANEYLHRALPGATATVRIQPVTNLVLIQVERPVRRNDEFADTMGDLVVEFVRRNLEPQIERQLATAARSDVDLYGMVVPYHVSIEVEKVRAGFSNVVQDTQIELIRLGYQIGQADGMNGPRTKKAIAHVQEQLGRAQDGQASEELLSILRDARPETPH